MGNTHPNKYNSCKVCKSFDKMETYNSKKDDKLRKHMKNFIGRKVILKDQPANWNDKCNIHYDNFWFEKYQIKTEMKEDRKHNQYYIPTVILSDDQVITDILYSNICYTEYGKE
jgi:hypothetical protein